MKNIFKIFSISVFVLLFTTQAIAQYWGDLKMGPSMVGFQAVQLHDYSRTFRSKTDTTGKVYEGERARPIQICVWSPISAKDNKPDMVFEDYMWLMASDLGKVKLNDSLKKIVVKDLVESGFNKEKIEKARKENMYAKNNSSSPKTEKHPVIIYASSWSAPSFENYILCEHLASNGYVVLSCTSKGANSLEMTGDMQGCNAQVEDLQFMINYAASLPFTDMNNIGIAGYSWGGLTNILLQQKNNKIAAVACYDGSIANTNGMDHFKNFPGASYSKMNVPFMYMSQKGRKGNAFYEKLNYSDAYSMIFPKNSHRDFASAFIKTVNKYKSDTTERFAIKNYEWISKYTLNFFNAYMMKDKSALAFLDIDPKEHGIADTVMTMVFKKARPMPPTENDFLKTFREQGFAKAKEMYLQVHSQDPDYNLFEEETLNSLGYGFYKKDKLDEAIELLQLNTEAFPFSANTFDSLADAWLKKGDKDKAIENYKKAVEIDPKSASKGKLEKLVKEMGNAK
jgi:dienelactone hydrolase